MIDCTDSLCTILIRLCHTDSTQESAHITESCYSHYSYSPNLSIKQGWATYSLATIFMRPTRPPQAKNNMDEYYVYIATVVGAARDKNHNSFSAHGGKKVAHH